ncbi:MAG: metal-dependent hydrolase [Calditrichia bacterium]|nr:metal-dependent hydrolase [Calditrichia bacterium]
MFIGHFGTAFAAKKFAPQLSLGTLILAAQFIDLLWPVLLLLGIEKVAIDPGNTAVTPLDFYHYPISHSLLGVLGWAVLFGLVYYLIKKNWKNSLVLGVLVLSHWVLDLLTHRPDLLLIPGLELKVGLGLWNSLIGTLIIELAIFAGGVYLYMKMTKAKNRKGSYGAWGLIIFLLLVYSSNIFGAAPPSVEPIAYIGLLQWLLVLWGYWIDRNRELK